MSAVAGFVGRHRFLLWFVVLNVLAGIGVGMARLVTSLYAVHLHADALALGLIAGAQSLGVLLMGLSAGVLVDQHGPVRMYCAGTLLAGLVIAAMPAVSQPMTLVALVGLQSLFMPWRFVSMNAVFMQQLERLGAAKAGWFRGTHMVGMFLLGPAAAVSAIALLRHAGSYWLVAATFGLTLLVAPQVLGHYEQPAQARRLSWAEIGAQLGLLRSEPPLRRAALVEFCTQAAQQYYAFFIVVIAIQQFHQPAARAAALVTVEGGAYVFALFTFGLLLERAGERRFALGGYAGTALALAGLGWAPSAEWLWGTALLLGLALGMVQIVTLTQFAQAGALLGRGRVAGLNAFCGPAGSLFGGLAGGLAGHVFGLQAAFLALAPVFVLLGLPWGQPPRRATTTAVADARGS